jgi:hypothetical protein
MRRFSVIERMRKLSFDLYLANVSFPHLSPNAAVKFNDATLRLPVNLDDVIWPGHVLKVLGMINEIQLVILKLQSGQYQELPLLLRNMCPKTQHP